MFGMERRVFEKGKIGVWEGGNRCLRGRKLVFGREEIGV